MIFSRNLLRWIPVFLFAVILTACAAAQAETGPVAESTAAPPTPKPEATRPRPVVEPTARPATQTMTENESSFGCNNPFGDQKLLFNVFYWEKTDFCIHSVDYSEIRGGGPAPDGIPAIDEPAFESVQAADGWLGDTWPVLYFSLNDDTRAYPLAILMWHEIVNDVVGGQPVALTFCPLCNATIAFSRELPDGTVLDFGTSGNLRNSDLIMYDRQTESWWQQFTGDAIVGTYTGTRLEFLPSQIIAWSEFKDTHPDGLVLSRDTGFSRDYGRNPYVGYDDINNNPFLYSGPIDGRLPAMARVAAIEIDDQWVAYPFSEISQVGVVNDIVGEVPLVVFWEGGTASALDRRNSDESRIVGSTAVYERTLEGDILTFELDEGGFRDLETGSTWNIFGEAVEGPMEGSRLHQVVSAEHFWFAWAAFRPDTVVWELER